MFGSYTQNGYCPPSIQAIQISRQDLVYYKKNHTSFYAKVLHCSRHIVNSHLPAKQVGMGSQSELFERS